MFFPACAITTDIRYLAIVQKTDVQERGSTKNCSLKNITKVWWLGLRMRVDFFGFHLGFFPFHFLKVEQRQFSAKNKGTPESPKHTSEKRKPWKCREKIKLTFLASLLR